MRREYKKALAALNKQQKAAVEAIEGPVLVIAGPGTPHINLKFHNLIADYFTQVFKRGEAGKNE